MVMWASVYLPPRSMFLSTCHVERIGFKIQSQEIITTKYCSQKMQPLSSTAICSCYIDSVLCLKYLHKVHKTILEGEIDKKEGKKNAKNLMRQLSKVGTLGKKWKRTSPSVNQASYSRLCHSRNTRSDN